MRTALVTLVLLSGCASSSPAEPSTPEGAARAWFEATKARDWARVWEMTASVPKKMLGVMTRPMAEKDDAAAKEMGMGSAAEARALSDRDFYVKLMTAYAAKGKFLLKDGAKLASVEVGPETNVREVMKLDKDLMVRRVKLHLEDGSVQELQVANEGGVWKTWEK